MRVGGGGGQGVPKNPTVQDSAVFHGVYLVWQNLTF